MKPMQNLKQQTLLYQKVPQPTNCGQSNFEISTGIESEDDVFFF